MNGKITTSDTHHLNVQLTLNMSLLTSGSESRETTGLCTKMFCSVIMNLTAVGSKSQTSIGIWVEAICTCIRQKCVQLIKAEVTQTSMIVVIIARLECSKTQTSSQIYCKRVLVSVFGQLQSCNVQNPRPVHKFEIKPKWPFGCW